MYVTLGRAGHFEGESCCRCWWWCLASASTVCWLVHLVAFSISGWVVLYCTQSERRLTMAVACDTITDYLGIVVV